MTSENEIANFRTELSCLSDLNADRGSQISLLEDVFKSMRYVNGKVAPMKTFIGVTNWQRVGNVWATHWQHVGNALATRGQHVGNAWATRWLWVCILFSIEIIKKRW